jgi:hypothetical protein
MDRNEFTINHEKTRQRDDRTFCPSPDWANGLAPRWAAWLFVGRDPASRADCHACRRHGRWWRGPEDEGPGMDEDHFSRLFAMAKHRDDDAGINFLVNTWHWLWGKRYPFERDWIPSRVACAQARSYRPGGVARLVVAAMATQPPRTELAERLASLARPDRQC